MPKTIAPIRAVNPQTITMSDHAYERAQERFGFKSKMALEYFKMMLGKAVYIAEVTEEETGKRALLYGARDSSNAVCILVSLDCKCIITVYKTTNSGLATVLKPTVEKIHKQELRKAQRIESSLLKKKEFVEVEANAMIYSAKLAIMKTTSKKKVVQEQEVIAKYEANINNLYKGIEEAQTTIRSVARSMVGML